MKSFLVIGNGAREAIFADKLAYDSVVYAVMAHPNPTIVEAIKKNNGQFIIGDINDGDFIADFAIKNNIDYVFVNSDNPLASGVVDKLLAKNVKAIGPTKEGARIEWDKIYSIDVVKKITPQFCPKYQVIEKSSQIDDAIGFFKGCDLVVKPQGLTGGKGVKVMGEHLKNIQEVKEYIQSLLKDDAKILLTEKLLGFEFTIMAITDGDEIIFAPATYDYPYRYNDDKGPGTGGMGCFTAKSKTLPFMTNKDFDDCCQILRSVIDYFKAQKIHFNGVLNGGFFLTEYGIKFMEFNARFGDPEGVNVLSLIDDSFANLLEAIYQKRLFAKDFKFLSKASVVKYLVTKEYPNKGAQVKFNLDVKKIKDLGIDVYFSAAKKSDSEFDYETVSSSRVVALSLVGEDIVSSSDKLNQIIDSFIAKTGLEYRQDIAGQKEITKFETTKFDANVKYC